MIVKPFLHEFYNIFYIWRWPISREALYRYVAGSRAPLKGAPDPAATGTYIYIYIERERERDVYYI